ncbi:MAG: amidase, partial [Aquabacterium sp.]|nr:amidase [Aquabacterium sp.]
MPLHDPAHAFVPYPDAPVPRAATGPLAGLSFAAKDLFDVAGYPTGGGSPIVLAMSGIKTAHATAVAQLLAGGAAFVGKTVTDEFAFSMNGNNAHFGAPVNGGAPDRISGGSSSGSASAVSNHLCDVALGTDTGGSVRAPASHCGLLGLRPTHGRISLQGVLDLAPSLDTCGFFARDASTFARVADVLLGADPQPLPGGPQPTARLLWPTEVWALLAPEVAAAAGAVAEQVQALLGRAAPVAVVRDSFDAMYWHFRHLQGREAWTTDGPLIERYAPPLGPGVAERFAWSRQVTDAQVAAAQAFRIAYTAQLDDLLGHDGVLLMPTMPDVAPLRAAPDAALEDYRNRAIRMLC